MCENSLSCFPTNVNAIHHQKLGFSTFSLTSDLKKQTNKHKKTPKQNRKTQGQINEWKRIQQKGEEIKWTVTTFKTLCFHFSMTVFH